MSTKQQLQRQRRAVTSSWSVMVAPLRRRLVAGAVQVRTAIIQCFPLLAGNGPFNGRKKKKSKQVCEPDDRHDVRQHDNARTCVLPIETGVSSTSPQLDAGNNETASSVSLPPMSPSSSSSSEATDSSSANNSDEMTAADGSTSKVAPVTTAQVILEPLRHSCRAAVNRTTRLTRSSLMKQVAGAASSSSTAAADNKKPRTKPVSSSSLAGGRAGLRPRLGLRSSASTASNSNTSAPSSSSSSSSNNASSSSSRTKQAPPRSVPTFHSASASTSCCLMTFVIFTNGSSTRMWFLVSKQPPRNARPNPSSRHFNNRTNSTSNGNNNDRDSNNQSQSRPSTASGRRRNASTPPAASSCSTAEKRRSLINRFLCSEDGKCTGSDGRSRLAIAASWACPAAIKLLLRRGAPVNSVDNRGKAALHYVAYGHSSVEAVVECLLLLLDAGAKVNCFDDEFNTPLHLAALAGCGPAMGLLLRRGADSSLPNATGRTPVFNFLNNAFNADNIPALLELACGSPYAFAGAFHFSQKMITSKSPPSQIISQNLSNAILDTAPSKKLIDDFGRIPLVLKLTLQPSLMPMHVDESLVLSSQFKELLCIFATCPPSLQLLATHSIRSAILDALSLKSTAASPSSASINSAANVIDLPNSLKCFLFS